MFLHGYLVNSTHLFHLQNLLVHHPIEKHHFEVDVSGRNIPQFTQSVDGYLVVEVERGEEVKIWRSFLIVSYPVMLLMANRNPVISRQLRLVWANGS